MTKFLLAVFVFLCFFSSNSYSTYWDWHVIKDGGQSNGIWPFNWIGFQRVDSDPSSKTLTCTGEGINQCKILGAEHECLGSHVNNMIDYAIKEQMNGILSGSYNENLSCGDEMYYCTVTWCTNEETGICDINTENVLVE